MKRLVEARTPGASWRRTALACSLAAVLGGCAVLPWGGESDPFVPNAPQADIVTIEVQNEHESDAVVYALWKGDRRRVGFVSAGEFERFEIPWRSPELGFQVELTGGRNFATQPILVSEGGSVHVQIPESLPSGR